MSNDPHFFILKRRSESQSLNTNILDQILNQKKDTIVISTWDNYCSSKTRCKDCRDLHRLNRNRVNIVNGSEQYLYIPDRYNFKSTIYHDIPKVFYDKEIIYVYSPYFNHIASWVLYDDFPKNVNTSLSIYKCGPYIRALKEEYPTLEDYMNHDNAFILIVDFMKFLLKAEDLGHKIYLNHPDNIRIKDQRIILDDFSKSFIDLSSAGAEGKKLKNKSNGIILVDCFYYSLFILLKSERIRYLFFSSDKLKVIWSKLFISHDDRDYVESNIDSEDVSILVNNIEVNDYIFDMIEDMTKD